jgi:hypothetical protein
MESACVGLRHARAGRLWCVAADRLGHYSVLEAAVIIDPLPVRLALSVGRTGLRHRLAIDRRLRIAFRSSGVRCTPMRKSRSLCSPGGTMSLVDGVIVRSGAGAGSAERSAPSGAGSALRSEPFCHGIEKIQTRAPAGIEEHALEFHNRHSQAALVRTP